MATTEPNGQIATDQRDKVALQRLYETASGLPEEEIAEYLEATRTSPALVEAESNPLWFLRLVDYDIETAAMRLARYWKERKKSFGEKAFLPVTDLSGAGPLTADDVAHLMSGALAALEDDDFGKPVLFFDLQEVFKIDHDVGVRLLFYLAAVMSPNAQAQAPGIVCVRFEGSEGVSMKRVRGHESSLALMKVLNNTMPVKLHVCHICAEIAQPAARAMFLKHTSGSPTFRGIGRNPKCKVHIHAKASAQNMLEELVTYGLRSTGLPPQVGGTWTYAGDVKPFAKQQSVETSKKVSTRPEPLLDNHEEHPSKRLKSTGEEPPTTNAVYAIKPNSSICFRALSELKQERKCSIRDILGHATMRSHLVTLFKDRSTLSLPQCKNRLESVLEAREATGKVPVLAGKEMTGQAPPANPKQSVEALQEACRKAALRNRLLKLMLSGVNKATRVPVSVSRQESSLRVERPQLHQETLRAQLISKVLERCRNP